jgi:hypothetical protein
MYLAKVGVIELNQFTSYGGLAINCIEAHCPDIAMLICSVLKRNHQTHTLRMSGESRLID